MVVKITKRYDKKIFRSFCIWCVNKIFVGTRFFKTKRKLLSLAGITIGKGSKVVGPIYIGGAAKLNIGNNTWIGKNFELLGNGSVCIGDGCDIAPHVIFATGSHDIAADPNRRAGKGITYNILVENGCWIGVRATIMGNTVIEAGSVVGAASLVNKDVEQNTVSFGVPAKPYKKL